MPSFSGKYYYTVDPKGRIIIPAPFREIMTSNYSTKLYVTNAPFERCLCIYPLEEWNKLQEQVRTKPRSDEAIRFFMRRVIASAIEVEMDKQGRILVPAALREDANISSDVVIAGQIERIELWDRDEWNTLFDSAKIDRKSLEEKLTTYGI
ncbi:MAG: division/cell wall cluster transcriptional repressor MraZ [Nitrospirota bacterium]